MRYGHHAVAAEFAGFPLIEAWNVSCRSPRVTPARFWTATVLFHALALAGVWVVARRWQDGARCTAATPRWGLHLLRDGGVLAVFVYLASVAATVAANLGHDVGRVHVGPISLRLLGQAIFAEGVLLLALLALRHRRCQRVLRAAALALCATGVFAANVRAYFIEPRMLEVRHYAVGPASPRASLRILHISDIQTPVIGKHEENALLSGLRHWPDLIVLTGDYVQDAMGRETEDRAAADLRRLIGRIGFSAPLGVYATEGDVGPPCAVVFRGTDVRCLTDASERITLRDGRTVAITGLSRGRGRARDARTLEPILRSAPPADHRIVISHAPDFVAALPFKIDLALAGHTHGGQVVIPFFGPPKTAIRLPRRYAGGLNDYRGTLLHVSRGVGMERGFEIPVRFLCPPEICILDVRL
jgi:predicted MPP superfamily phosphohydrolase